MACDRKPANNAAVSIAAALTGRSRTHVVDVFHAAASTSRDQRQADPDDVAAALFRLRGAVTASDLPDHDRTRLAVLAADATRASPGPTRAQLAHGTRSCHPAPDRARPRHSSTPRSRLSCGCPSSP